MKQQTRSHEDAKKFVELLQTWEKFYIHQPELAAQYAGRDLMMEMAKITGSGWFKHELKRHWKNWGKQGLPSSPGAWTMTFCIFLETMAAFSYAYRTGECPAGIPGSPFGYSPDKDKPFDEMDVSQN